MADAMEATRQDIKHEAADELVGGERHNLLAIGAIATIVVVADGDAVLTEPDITTVRDGHPMGVAGQVGGEICRGRRCRSQASSETDVRRGSP